jgi:hypothetical protein
MESIIQLLKQKNHFLEKLLRLNERELTNFSNAKFDHLENFYQTREKIIDTVLFIDAKVDKSHAQISPKTQFSEEFKNSIKAEWYLKDKLAQRIQQQDLEILTLIEDAKSKIIKELQEVKKVRKSMGAYKTPNHILRVDEEA